MGCVDYGTENRIPHVSQQQVVGVFGESRPDEVGGEANTGAPVDPVSDLVECDAGTIAKHQRWNDGLHLRLPLQDPKERRAVVTTERLVQLNLGLRLKTRSRIKGPPVEGDTE